MNSSLHIVHIIRDLDIASGGPSRSVPALVRSLVSLEGVSCSLLYQDRGKPIVPLTEGEVDYRSVPAKDFVFAQAFSKYLPQQAQAERRCLFHLHGLWSPTLHWAARYAARNGLPYVISTRGMLASWCLQHKSIKKKFGWWLYQNRDLRQAACLLTSSEAEAREVRSLLPGQPVAMIPNACEERPADLPVTPQKRNSHGRVALAMGRLHPVKGFAELIEAWAALRPEGWVLAIAGPDEDGYRAILEELISRHRLSEHVRLLGPVEDRGKWILLDSCDLFVAPSKTENFGMAIAEAMLAGRPVITTTGTPWSCLPEIDAGWWVSPSPDALQTALRSAIDLSDTERRAMGRRAREYAQRFGPSNITGELLSLYRWLLDNAEQPSCVLRT